MSQTPMYPKCDSSAPAIYDHLIKYVTSQEDALVQLSMLFSMHVRWFASADAQHPAPNALLIGPTGVGKTYAMRRATDYLSLPYVIVDTTSLVPSGIVGMRLEGVLGELVANARDMISREPALADQILGVDESLPDAPDVFRGIKRHERAARALASRGVVFLDEFDKLTTRQLKSRSGEDQGGTLQARVQRRLLKFLEGSTQYFNEDPHVDSTATATLDTAGILCIASGAFSNIEDLRSVRTYEVAVYEDQDRVLSQDVVNFGFLPELVARLPILVQYQDLGIGALRTILADRINGPLGVWDDYFKSIGAKLDIADDGLDAVAEYAASLHMGARGLPQILHRVLARETFSMERDGGRQLSLTSKHFRQGRK